MEKKAWRQLHKNAANCIKQVLEATPHKTAAIRPPTTHHKTSQIKTRRYAGDSWRNKDGLISNILRWTLSHGQAKAGRSARTYIQRLYADTWYCLEDLAGKMDFRDGWCERVREICAGSVTWWWRYLSIPIFFLSMFSLFSCFVSIRFCLFWTS